MATVEDGSDVTWSRALERACDAQEHTETLWEQAFFLARQAGQLHLAVERSPYTMTRALAMTRALNERTGRRVRWGDGRR